MIQYKRSSWHYRFWNDSVNNAAVDNIFAHSYRDYDSGIKHPTENFCSYWAAIIGYLFLQVPLMTLFFGAIVFALAFIPLMTLYAMFDNFDLFRLALTIDSQIIIGTILLGCYTFVGWICALRLLLGDTFEDSVPVQYYKAVKDKYCPRLDFYKGTEK